MKVTVKLWNMNQVEPVYKTFKEAIASLEICSIFLKRSLEQYIWQVSLLDY